MSITPANIQRVVKDSTGVALNISWSNGGKSSIGSKELRQACPCATCREKRGDSSHSKPLGGGSGRALLNIVSSSSDEELNLKEIWAVGNYALGMRWGDSHDSGIYTYRYLLELSNLNGAADND